ncbi:MAG: transporter [Symbiobacteriaceae bacterium]|jgi:Na+/melibiose symporter-like transporter|nr:transporter [Symbiobacteriaceae bacterium]
MRLNWGKTFVLGFGFLAISAVWPLYDAYMPLFLDKYIASSLLVGAIMGLDNVLGFTLQPWIGSRSDRTQSSWGRRRPYLLVGMPIAALSLIALNWTYDAGLVLLLLTTGVLNLAMSLFRSPTVALMPDLTPPPLRSKANGIINLMGGVGAAIVIQVGKMVYREDAEALPFLVAAGIMVVVFFLFLLVIREPAMPEGDSSVEETPQSLLASLRYLMQSRDKNTLLLLGAIFSWFVAYQAVNTWFTTFAMQRFDVEKNVAAGALLAFAGAIILGALPAGYIGTAIGRRKTIMIGLGGMVVSFAAMYFATSLTMTMGMLVVGGLFWALININSYPMVVQMCNPKDTGTFTGLYYIFQGVGGISGPVLAGGLFDLMGGSTQPLWGVAMLFMGLALWLMSRVQKGEAQGAH